MFPCWFEIFIWLVKFVLRASENLTLSNENLEPKYIFQPLAKKFSTKPDMAVYDTLHEVLGVL